MAEHQGATDQVHEIQLESKISQAVWDRPVASPGQEVKILVYTHFVGNGSEIKISIHNKSGRRLDRLEGTVYGNRFKTAYTVSERAEDAIYFEAELSDHGLKEKSEEMEIVPPIEITNPKWSEQKAHRGDLLTLTADVSGAPDGTEGLIEIYEYDADEAHDFITKIPVLVEGNKIEAEWEYEYHEDTDEIPTDEEIEKGYNPPEYFFKVIIRGNEAESEILEFKDWIEIIVKDETQQPVSNQNYILHLPDGQELNGTTDEDGKIRQEEMPPGPWWVELVE